MILNTFNRSYCICSNTGATKNNYSSKRRLQLKPKNSCADQRAPKLGQRLSTTIRTILETLPEHKLDHQTVLVSGSDYVRDENDSNIVLVSLLMFFWGGGGGGIFTLTSLSHSRELLVQDYQSHL